MQPAQPVDLGMIEEAAAEISSLTQCLSCTLCMGLIVCLLQMRGCRVSSLPICQTEETCPGVAYGTRAVTAQDKVTCQDF